MPAAPIQEFVDSKDQERIVLTLAKVEIDQEKARTSLFADTL